MSREGLFLFNRSGEVEGPVTAEEVVQRLGSGGLTRVDYVFDPAKDDWVLILNCAPIMEILLAGKPEGKPGEKPKIRPKTATVAKPSGKPMPVPVAAPISTSATPATGAIWHILRGEQQMGPYSMEDMIDLLQSKEAFSYDLVWVQGWSDWQRLASVPEFHSTNVAKFVDQHKVDKRKVPRTSMDGKVIVHDDRDVWLARSVEISEGGAALVIPNALLLPGLHIKIHFHGWGKIPAFNATAEIVNKRFDGHVKSRNADVTYDLKFLKINDDVKSALKAFVTSIKKDAA